MNSSGSNSEIGSGATTAAAAAAQPVVSDEASSAGSNLVSASAQSLSARDKVVQEIYTTEAAYVHQLDLLVEECMVPVSKGKFKAVFTPDELRAIFSNIEMVRSINIRLLKYLADRLENWAADSLVGDIFLSMLPFFKVYREYYTNYEAGIELLTKLSKKKDVQAYLKYCEEEVSQGHKVAFLLVTPVQRIPRYSLLLKELLKQTAESHPDFENISKALRQIQEFTSTINESIRETDNYRKLAELVTDNKNYIGFEKIVAPNRTLVHETDVEVKMGTRVFSWMLLFNDILTFASRNPSKPSKRNVEEVLPLEYVWFEDLAGLGSETVMRVITPDIMFLVETPSVASKQKWIGHADRTISKHLTKRGIEFDGEQRRFGFTLANGDKYEGEWEYGQPNGTGTFSYANGNTYSGKLRDGKPHGQGKIVYTTGGYYEGMWVQGRPDGLGTLVSNGATYTGNWLAGQRSGQGRIEWPNGDVYDGAWKADRMSGTGTLSTHDGTRYTGGWLDDMFDGTGELTWPSGKYVGEWKADKRHGQGCHTLANGDSYTGSWKDDLRDGQGLFVSGDGAHRYEGTWDRNTMHGSGLLELRGNLTYQGEFLCDKKHGVGKLTYAFGGGYDGHWINDRKDGEGTLTNTNGSTYTGHWKADKYHGRGVWRQVDGACYDGEWIEGLKEGRGNFRWSDGSSYSGTWLNDKMHGQGIFSNSDGTQKYIGAWELGVRHGQGVLSDALGTFEGEWVYGKKNGAGKHTSNTGDLVLEATWQNNLRDGEASLSINNAAAIKVFWREGRMELPTYCVLPPPVPGIKEITRL